MKINVEDFCRWIDDMEQETISFKDKCFVKSLVNEYGMKYSVEEQEMNKAFSEWEDWLDKKIQYSKDDISKGLPTSTFNAIARGGLYVRGMYTHREFNTNRDLLMASDNDLAELRNMSMNKVAKVREYLELNRQRILKGEQVND